MASTPQLEAWALPRIQQLLPLDDESIKQIIQYATTLRKDAAAEHLKNLLGDDGKALEFISSFNQRRQIASPAPTPQAINQQQASSSAGRGDASWGGGSRRGRGGKKRANIHALPPRQVEQRGDVGGAYVKRDVQDYVPQVPRSRQTHKEHVADSLALRERAPDATQLPLITDDASATTKPITSKMPPSAAGSLVSDVLSPKKAASSVQSSRTSSPAPRTKINITGGTAMHGASTTLSDLDSAIKTLEIQTNPRMAFTAAENEKRKCPCMATRHPLLDIAPNCLNCGKIICVKEGLGPCTFCGSSLLTQDEISKVLRVLKDERGDEKTKVNNAGHKKADVAYGKGRALTGRDFLAQTTARPSPLSSAANTPAGSDDEGVSNAKAHRDKLLAYQANNARRTQVHDEAADYDIPTSGTNMWASPAERAQQLKRQQKVLRETEWNARPEYEKRRVVASIDLKGDKVVRRMAEVERPDFSVPSEDDSRDDLHQPAVPTSQPSGSQAGKGAFSNNPLAAGLIRPRAREEKASAGAKEKRTMWRRVQDDDDDNEAWILDGGVYGGKFPEDRALGAEEHAFG